MATKADIVTRALRRLRVIAANRAATADMMAEGTTVLESLFEEFQAGTSVAFDLDDVPEKCVNALSDLLASELAPEYSKSPPVARSVAWGRLRRATDADTWIERRQDYMPTYY